MVNDMDDAIAGVDVSVQYLKLAMILFELFFNFPSLVKIFSTSAAPADV